MNTKKTNMKNATAQTVDGNAANTKKKTNTTDTTKTPNGVVNLALGALLATPLKFISSKIKKFTSVIALPPPTSPSTGRHSPSSSPTLLPQPYGNPPMSNLKNGQRIELFVYGSLRVGQALHDWLSADIFRWCEATTPGHLYELRNGEYPAALFGLDTSDRIHGEVLTVDLTESVLGCIEMENAAGYVCRWVDVTFENGNTTKALTFEFTIISGDVLGDRIIGGDWVEHVNTKREADGEQELEFLATMLGEMVTGDPELYTEIIEVILEESDDDPSVNDEVAMSDLELMLYNPKYVTELRDYIQQAVTNMNTEDNEYQTEN